jgi:hypothetical protein
VISAGSGCADAYSAVSRRSSLTSLSNGKADCRKIASMVSRCSVLTEDLPPGEGGFRSAPGLAHVNPLLKISCREAGHCQACRQAGEDASPDHGDSRDRGATEPILGAGVHC